jgi:hypothetical protein
MINKSCRLLVNSQKNTIQKKMKRQVEAST